MCRYGSLLIQAGEIGSTTLSLAFMVVTSVFKWHYMGKCFWGENPVAVSLAFADVGV